MNGRGQTVTIVQRRLTQYRVPLFERMRELLLADGLTLRILHGQGTAGEVSKNDAGQLTWADELPTRYALQGRLCWQPFMSSAAGSDLIIVTQENKLVNNLLAIAQPMRKSRLAFWGHGRNMQAHRPDTVKERFKRWTTNRVDWWFAYTKLSAEFVQEDGFSPRRITVLNNSIDTSLLNAEISAARHSPKALLREQMGLPPTGHLAVFIGSLYGEKRIPWLLAAAEGIANALPGFNMAIAGDGPQRAAVLEAAADRPFLHYFGSVHGARKAQLLACADVMLNPGLVGLGILDAFVAGIPLLTTDCKLHSPEIAYLQSGSNGLMTPDNLPLYIQATVGLLNDNTALAAFASGAAESANLYSIDSMARRFCVGINDCLNGSAP